MSQSPSGTNECSEAYLIIVLVLFLQHTKYLLIDFSSIKNQHKKGPHFQNVVKVDIQNEKWLGMLKS